MSEMKIGEIMAFKCVEAKDEHNRCDGCMFCDDEDFRTLSLWLKQFRQSQQTRL